MSKILLIEDEDGLQMTLQDRLEAEGYQVRVEGDGLRGEKAGLEEKFDLILLDVMLPGRDGFQVCSNLREAGVRTPILILTARGSDFDMVQGLRIGADDYLGKPFEMSVLLARIYALLRRNEEYGEQKQGDSDPEEVIFGEYRFNRLEQQLYGKEQPITMNTQEYRLLDFMIINAGRVLSRNELLDEVWGYDSETSSRTVDVHIAWLRKRLNEEKNPRHILTVRGRGYKFVL